MANPTTNYGWPMPTSTDLVTDLPADFAAFGQPVDTSLKALNPETTLGDIAYRSATANTNTRLGVGSAGQVLTVASGVPSWATPAAATSGVTLIQRTSFSNVAGTSTTFDGVFSSTYENYTIMIESMFAATAVDDLQMQGIYSGTTETTQYYGSSLYSPVTGATVTITGTNNASQFTIASQAGGTTGRSNGFFVCNRMGGGLYFSVNGQIQDNGNLNAPSFFGGGTVTSRTYTGFLLKSSSSNITGTVSVYGWAKS